MIRATVLVLLVAGSALLSSAGTDPVDCTFSNPRYAGKCVEQATPSGRQTPVQACRVVLNCLNDPRCVKTYCNATTVRGGWTHESPADTPRER